MKGVKGFSCLLLFFLFLKSSCKKISSDNIPPATQSGKNTLGFYLNGEKWIPQGSNGTPNLKFNYDKNYDGGVFNISAYRAFPNDGKKYIIMYGNPFQTSEKITLPNSKFGVGYTDQKGCSYDYHDSLVKVLNGYFNITKLDQSNHIFAAEFEFNLIKKGCDTIHITQGRCDFSY